MARDSAHTFDLNLAVKNETFTRRWLASCQLLGARFNFIVLVCDDNRANEKFSLWLRVGGSMLRVTTVYNAAQVWAIVGRQQ